MEMELEKASQKCALSVLESLTEEGAWSVERTIHEHMKLLVKYDCKDYKSIGLDAAIVRHKSGIPPWSVAKRMGVTLKEFKRLEAGASEWTVKILAKYLAALKHLAVKMENP